MPVRLSVYPALLALLLCLGTALESRAQADTVLIASMNGEPGQALVARRYTNPQGTRVNQYILTLTPSQAATLGLMLHTGGEDSIRARIIAASGRHELMELNKTLSSKDLLLLGPTATDPVDCGSAEPCKPNRLVIDLRLASRPNERLWVCHVVLGE